MPHEGQYMRYPVPKTCQNGHQPLRIYPSVPKIPLFGHGVSGIESIAVDKIKNRPNRDARAIDNEIADYVSMVYFAFPWLATAACLAASSSGSAR